jgi:hypothetical protein
MPWRISSTMSQRLEFVLLASQERANLRELCRRFGISDLTMAEKTPGSNPPCFLGHRFGSRIAT